MAEPDPVTPSPVDLRPVWSASDPGTSSYASSLVSDESYSSFTPGIGMLSGKAILAVGKAELRAMGWVWAMYRRAIINSRFPHPDVHSITKIDDMYEDLLQFAFGYFHTWHKYLYEDLREHMYSEHTYGAKMRHWAHRLLLCQIESRCWADLRHALERLPDYDRALTIKQLRHDPNHRIVPPDTWKAFMSSTASSRASGGEGYSSSSPKPLPTEALPNFPPDGSQIVAQLAKLANVIRVSSGRRIQSDSAFQPILDYMDLERLWHNSGTVDLIVTLGDALQESNEFTAMSTIHDRAFQSYQLHAQSNFEDLAWKLLRKARDAKAAERYAEAAELLQTLLPRLEFLYGEAHDEVIAATYALAVCEEKCDRLMQAKRWYHKGLAQFNQAHGINREGSLKASHELMDGLTRVESMHTMTFLQSVLEHLEGEGNDTAPPPVH